MSIWSNRRLLLRFMTIVLIGVAALVFGARSMASAPQPTIVVTTVPELVAVLTPANAGKTILVRAGDYEISQALTVPDDATLVGEGQMIFDESGLPIGFEPSGRTVIRSAPALAGNLVSLGDGATIKSLVIEDVAGRLLPGNPVAVVSRAAGDFISAQIAECEIVNPNPSGATPQGPSGRGLALYTRNPNSGLEPPPDDGAVLRVQMTGTIVRSPAGGSGIFAINFASRTEIELVLDGNVIAGGLEVVGGSSRPDAVTGAGIFIRSDRNLYRSDSLVPTLNGWNLVGGATAPIPGLVSQASTFNSVRLHSTDDRIEAFASGVRARSGLRTSALSGPSSSNRIDMNLRGTNLQTTTEDLVLLGAQSLIAGVSPGDDNEVHLVVHGAVGSGPRANTYADSPGDPGTGNRLEIVGNRNAFARTNENIDPLPPAEVFTAEP